MLDNSYTKKENAIEEVVYDFLKDCKLVEMSKDVTGMYIEIGMMPKDMKLAQHHKPQVFQIIEKSMIEYVVNHKGEGIKIKPQENKKWKIEVFADSDYFGDKDNRRSVTGYIVHVNEVASVGSPNPNQM